MKVVGVFLLSVIGICCSQSKLSELYFLEGTWKEEGKERYEIWERNSHDELIGSAYKLVDGKQVIFETLQIKE